MTTVKLKPVDRMLTRMAYCSGKIYSMTGIKIFRTLDRSTTNRMFEKYVPESIRAAGKMHACLSFDFIEY